MSYRLEEVNFDPFAGAQQQPAGVTLEPVDFDPFAPKQPAQAPEAQWHEQPDDVGLAGDYHFDLDAFSPETGRKVGRALEGAWHEVKGVPGALATALRSHHQVGSQNLEMDEITRPTDIARMSELTRSGVPIEEARRTVIAERDVRRQTARDEGTEALRGLETAVRRDPNQEFDERSDSFLEDVSRGTASFLPIMGITAASPATGAVMTYGLIQGMKQQELEEAGIDPKTAFRSAVLAAAASTPIEFAGNLFQIGLLKRAFSPAVGAMQGVGGGLALSSLSEGGEEYLQAWPDGFSNYWAEHSDKPFADAVESFLETEAGKTHSEGMDAAAIGATSGLMLQGSGTVAGSALKAYRFMRDQNAPPMHEKIERGEPVDLLKEATRQTDGKKREERGGDNSWPPDDQDGGQGQSPADPRLQAKRQALMNAFADLQRQGQAQADMPTTPDQQIIEQQVGIGQAPARPAGYYEQPIIGQEQVQQFEQGLQGHPGPAELYPVDDLEAEWNARQAEQNAMNQQARLEAEWQARTGQQPFGGLQMPQAAPEAGGVSGKSGNNASFGKAYFDLAVAGPNTPANFPQGQAFREEGDGSLNVPFDSALGVSSDAALAKGSADGPNTDAKHSGNFRNTNALFNKGYGSLDVPTQNRVLKSVLALVHDDEIFRAVVPSIPVDVMNKLVGGKFSANDAFSNKAVLIHALATNNDLAILAPAVDSIVNAAAISVAEVPSENKRRALLDVASAAEALHDDSHSASSTSSDYRVPTEEQSKAGNYKKRHIKFNGMDISIENEAGSIRYGNDNTGMPWASRLSSAYGYIKGTKGADKDHVDVFLAPGAEAGGPVFVVNQNDPATGKFDEHKAIIGATDEQQARDIYLANYEPGWQGLGSIVQMSMDGFKTWAKSEKTKRAAVGDVETSADLPGAGTVTAPSQGEASPYTFTDISEKAFVVTGDTKPIKDKMKSLGGLWNGKRGGWVFSKKKREKVEAALGVAAKEKQASGDDVRKAEELAAQYQRDGRTRSEFIEEAPLKLGWIYRTFTGSLQEAPGTDARRKAFESAGYSRPGSVAEIWDRAVGGKGDKNEVGNVLAVLGGLEGTSVEIVKAHDGFSVIVRDDDSGKSAGAAYIYKDYDQAKRAANAISKGMDPKSAKVPGTLGKNRRGLVVGQDDKGVRYYDDGGIRIMQTVGVIPGGGIKIDTPERLHALGGSNLDFLTTEELEANQTKVEQPAEKTESTGIDAVVDHFAKKLYSGAKYDSILQARKEAAEVMGEKVQGGTDMAKIVDEAIELAIVKTARRMIKEMRKAGATDLDIYQDLVALYAQQPNLGVRTSTSVAQQAYSTPVPIAFLASRLAGIKNNTRVLEPTAGNGMLLIEADNPVANELNPDRAARLRSLGFKVGEMDAASEEFTAKVKHHVDAVIANPPFGRVRDENGEAKSWTVAGYETKELDHAIVLRSLELLLPDGKAVLIIGGKQGEGQNRALKYHAVAQRQFYKALFDNFKVVDHFTVDGKLYAKQGAGFPIDVIVIDGRGKTEGRKFPAANPPRIYESFAAMEELFNEKSMGSRIGVSGDDAGVSGGVDGDRGQGKPAGTGGDTPAGVDTAGGRTGAGDQGMLGDSGKRGADRPVSEREGAGEGGAVGDLQSSGQTGTGKQAGRDDGSGKQGLSAQGNQADTGLVQADDAAGVGGRSGDDISLDALMGEWDRQEEASKPQEQAPKAAPKEKTAAERMAESAASLNENLQAALDVFSKFGGLSVKVVKEGDPINQSLYEAIRPHLLAAYKDLKDMGLAGADLIREFVAKARAVFGAKSAQARPYFEKFAGEIVEMERTPAQKEDNPASIKSEKKVKGGQSGTALQDAYGPRSKSTPMGTLVPKNMTTPLREALDRLEAERGNIDQYVAKELGYSQKELEEYFAGEQIDAIALAIHNIDKGAGFIIGDQTGIGKGRVNAAIMRYAKRKGAVPVFVTMKPDLYADMVRDLQDIGMQGFNPLPTNGGLTGDKAIPLPDGRTLRTAAAAKHSALLDAQGKKGVSGYDAVFTTYSQLQSVKGKDTARRAFIRQIAPNAIFILDESHNAGGAESSARKAKDAQPTTAEFVRDVLGMTDHGVFYSSATYAKRPDVMSLYFKTDMRYAVDDISALAAAISEGGIPLQQIVAAQLTESGQYIRRERSFEGASVEVAQAKADMEAAEQSATIMRSILAFDKIKQEALSAVNDAAMGEGEAVGDSGSTGEKGASSTNFTSVMHNLIGQSLLAMKADAAVDAAIEARARGEKPIITLANTMGSFIEQHVTAEGVSIGQEIFLTFKDLYRRYLEKTRTLTRRDSRGKIIEQRLLTDEEFGPEGVAAYNAVLAEIERSNFGDLPISPIDYITSKLNAANISVGEITGRTATVDYSDGVPIYRSRRPSPAANIETMRSFNGGQTDVIILNQSGSTGISLHSSATFADKSKRTMIIVQPELNIDVFMQTLGRVFRTGQVVPPAYKLLTSDLPAEKRPAAVLGKKMAGLNANTTASRKTDTTFQNIPDFLNEYGDLVTAQIMEENPEIHAALGSPLKEGDGGYERDGAVRKVTGRIPMLPLKDQQDLYDMIEGEYSDLIAQLEATGTSTLEAKTLQLDARLISSADLTAAKDVGGTSPFAAESKVGLFDVKSLGKPYTPEQVRKLIEQGKVNKPDIEKTRQETVAWMNKRLESIKGDDAKSSFQERVGQQYGVVQDVADRFEIGSPVVVSTKDNTYEGVVVRMEHKGSANPSAPSSWKMTIAIADSARQLVVPFSKLQLGYGQDLTLGQVAARTSNKSLEGVLESFSKGQTTTREKRYIAYGNVLAAYSSVGNQGQIVNFEDSDGNTRAGIMFKKNATLGEIVGSADVSVPDYESMVKFFDRTDDNGMLKSADKNLKITRQGGYWTFLTAASKAKGAQFFLNGKLIEAAGRDFVKSGNSMKLTTHNEVAAKMVNVLRQQGFGIVAGSHVNEAREVMGLAKKGEEKAAPQYQTAQTINPSPVDLRAAFPWADKIEQEGNRFVITKGKVSFSVQYVRAITPDKIAFQLHYGRTPGPRDLIAGAYLGKGEIIVSRHGDRWTLSHEFEHFLEDMGLINKMEQKILDAEVAKLDKAGKLTFKLMSSATENRAYFVQHALERRDWDRKTPVGRILQKIADFIDALVNLHHRTARGIVRDVESGRIMETAPDGTVVGTIKYAVRTRPAPAKTARAYKLFRVDRRQPGKLFPLFVDANTPVEIGVWLDAEAGERTASGKVKSKLGPLAFRPGWHGGDLPIATHIGEGGTPPTHRPENQVWAEVEFAADVDWQAEANRRGTNRNGKIIPVKAHITDMIPEDGFYRYKTNPNMTGNWLIGGSMRVIRVLSDSEVGEINARSGVADLPRRAGVNLSALGFGTKSAPNQQVKTSIWGKGPVPVVTVQAGAAPSLAEAQQALRALRGSSVVNKDTGWEIGFSKRGLGKTESHQAAAESRIGAVRLREMTEKAVLVATEENRDETAARQVRFVHHFYVPMRMGGELALARIVVKETPQGQKYYDSIVAKMEKPEAGYYTGYQDREAAATGSSIMSIRTLLEMVKVVRPDHYPAAEDGDFEGRAADTHYQLAGMNQVKRHVEAAAYRPETFGRLNFIHTQVDKALKSPQFRLVFDRVSEMARTVSASASSAAALAEDILPSPDKGFVATLKDVIDKGRFADNDLKEASVALSAGSLAGDSPSPFDGKVFTEDELLNGVEIHGKTYRLTPDQVEAYRQTRASVNKSVWDLATSEAWKRIRPFVNPDLWQVFADNSAMSDVRMESLMYDALDLAERDAKAAQAAVLAQAGVRDLEQLAAHEKELTKFIRKIRKLMRDMKKAEQSEDAMEKIEAIEEKMDRLESEYGMSFDDALEDLKALRKAQRAHREATKKVANIEGTIHDVFEEDGIFDKARRLQAGGYMPLMRFGAYEIRIEDEDGRGVAMYRFDSSTEAKLAYDELVAKYQGDEGITITRPVKINTEAWKRFKDVNPDSILLFAKESDFGADQAMQEVYRKLYSDRSSMKRLIRRKGIPGYSDDLQRILSSFITSNARRIAANYHAAPVEQLITDIGNNDVQQEAQKVFEFFQGSGDPGSWFRSFAAHLRLLGSPMTAAINGTQVFTSTFPELVKHGATTTEALGRIIRAYRDRFKKDPARMTADEEWAIAKGVKDGTIDSAEIFHLYGMGTQTLIDKIPGGRRIKRSSAAALRARGMMFAWAEKLNRHVTLLSAFRMFRDQGMSRDDAYQKAREVVDVTQGRYGKENRPNLGRNPIAGAMLTFLQYKIMTLEQIVRNARGNRQAKKAAALQILVLLMLGGLGGAPFAEDVMDLLDIIMQTLFDRAWLTKDKLKKAVRGMGEAAAGALVNEEAGKMFGRFAADFFDKGFSGLPGMPMDVSGRYRMGGTIPGLKVLKPSTKFRESAVLDAFGVPGGMIDDAVRAVGLALDGEPWRGAKLWLPSDVQNYLKGAGIAATGKITDTSGRTITEGGLGDALLQSLGAQPRKKTVITSPLWDKKELLNLTQKRERDFVRRYAEALADGDNTAAQAVTDDLAAWNENNPDWPIRITKMQIRKAMMDMNMSTGQRQIRMTPREVRKNFAPEAP